MTTSRVYVAGSLAGCRQRSPLAFLTLGAKVYRRLLPIGKTALGNLLTEDVLQQILSCSPHWLNSRAHGLHAHAHAHSHTVRFPSCHPPRRSSAAWRELPGLRWGRTKLQRAFTSPLRPLLGFPAESRHLISLHRRRGGGWVWGATSHPIKTIMPSLLFCSCCKMMKVVWLFSCCCYLSTIRTTPRRHLG